MSNKPVIPIFYACDDAFVKFTIVSLHSMKKKASRDYEYRVYVLHTSISEEMKSRLNELADEDFIINFEDVTDYLRSISKKLPIRDYYSNTTYFRLFIAEMFPEYDKAIYIDSDTVVQGDISEMFNLDIGEAYVGACHDTVFINIPPYGEYSEKVMGISRYNMFNAGILLINCDRFRLCYVLDKFIHFLHEYDFVVTQDEDYLNLICKDHVYWMDQRWNTLLTTRLTYPIEEANIIHYNMACKPWHYRDCLYADIFWAEAKETSVYEQIREQLESYTDEDRERDRLSGVRLAETAQREIDREDNYLRRINRTSRNKERVEIIEKIEKYEREGRFDEDVENDPPGRVLMPDEINYLKQGVGKKLKTKVAFMMARKFVRGLIEEKKMIIKGFDGIENFRALRSGAVITCNHFNAYDSFAIQLAYEEAHQPDRTFYRVIREGNYTSFPGFYGFLMRHCNTLPLSSNRKTLAKFTQAVGKLLRDGNFVLIYPEQGMWWNYRKPRPLKSGAFMFAAKTGVPVLPCFITMKDSDVMGDDGFYVQEYTIHVSKPIWPDKSLPYRDQIADMSEKNYAVWKDIYEKEYEIPLSYSGD